MKRLAQGIALTGLVMTAPAVSAAPEGFDGRWAVQMVTDSGICDRASTYLIAVDDGRIRYLPQDGGAAPSVSGQISTAGSVDLDIRKGMAKVDASGRVQGSSGSGTWRAGALCSGRWTAQKRSLTQASR